VHVISLANKYSELNGVFNGNVSLISLGVFIEDVKAIKKG